MLLLGRFRPLINHSRAESANYVNAVLRTRRSPRFVCTVCGAVSPFFVHKANDLRVSWNSVCPNCDSRSRHRGLHPIYQSLAGRSGIKIIHFAPEPIFFSLFRANPSIVYCTADLYLSDVDYPNEDIQRLSFEDHSFDALLCNHVLEHVPDDELAISEIGRIVKVDGVAIITIPGDFQRQETIRFAQLEHNGHYRDYGMDILAKLKKAFPYVDAQDLSAFNDDPSGLKRGIRRRDMAFLCYRHAAQHIDLAALKEGPRESSGQIPPESHARANY